MRTFASRVGSALAALVFAAAAHAQQTCYQFRVQNFNNSANIGPYFDSKGDADADAVNRAAPIYAPSGVSCGNGQNSDSWEIDTPAAFSTFPSTGTGYARYRCSSNGATGVRPYTITNRVNPGGCPTCPAAGTNINAAIPDTAGAGTELCGGDGCVYKVKDPIRTIMGKGGVTRVATASSTGRACSTTQSNSSLEKGDNQDCVEGASVAACGDPDGGGGQGCGYFNGDYICTGHVPDGSCVSFASGGTACVVSSGGAPTGADVPTDSGGEPVEPDGVLTSGGTTVNYYTGGTVAGNSSAGGSTPPTVPGQGGSALGAPGRGGYSGGGTGSSGGGSSSGGGVGEGELSCQAGDEDCEGIEDVGSGEGIADTAPCYEEGGGALSALAACGTDAFETVRDAVMGSDMVELVSGLATSVPTGGACPSATFTAFGETYDFMASGCDLVDSSTAVIGLCFLIGWSLVGVRILMKTF